MAADMILVRENVEKELTILNQVREEIAKVIIGQAALVDRLLIAMLCSNHVLIEGVPGLAKTLTITTLAKTIQASFRRIQFTPDLLPGDLIGTLIYNPKSGEFTTRKGPIFANIILADEINRAPAKVQSALLEAMQERQVTIGEESFPLDDPFMVLATQNPIEQEGTYPLPEAQIDRFMFKLLVTYPSKTEERQILQRMAGATNDFPVRGIIGPADLSRIRALTDSIYMDEKIEGYILNLVGATRDPGRYNLNIGDLIRYGASPRATIFLAQAAKAGALLAGRGYVTPQDVKSIAPDILRHRVIVTYEAEAEEKTSDDLVQQILDNERADQENPLHPDLHPQGGERCPGRGIPQRLQGPRHGVRRGPHLPAGRRHQDHRLERHGPHRSPLCEALRRRAGDHGLFPGRPLRFRLLWQH
jgi:MoxR-like ATPase